MFFNNKPEDDERYFGEIRKGNEDEELLEKACIFAF